MRILIETKKMVKQELKLIAKIVENLQTIENEKLYGELGYSSLFKYCVKELGYSEMQAFVRVSCVRLVSRHPEIKEKMKDNQISASVGAKAERFFQEEKLCEEKEKQFIEEIAGKSSREVDQIIEEERKVSRKRPRSKNIMLREYLLKKIEKLQKQMGVDSELELIQALVEEKLEQNELKKPTRRERGSKRQRYIPRKVKEQVIERAGHRCEYVNEKGERCSARTNLEWDHVRPIAHGGESGADNIQRLCRAHNQMRARQCGLSREGKSTRPLSRESKNEFDDKSPDSVGNRFKKHRNFNSIFN